MIRIVNRQSSIVNHSLPRFDSACRKRTGASLIGGVDEAGRGALAGPVVAACVVLEPRTRLGGVDDSKVLTPESREKLAPIIIKKCAAWSVGWASAAEIDRINILQATLLAARRALDTLAVQPEYLLTDFLKIDPAPCPIEPLVDGDATSQAIAAASILAKVARDRIMTALENEYPQYGFASHKGYGTPQHWSALNEHGPSTIHRLTYNGVGFFMSTPNVRARSFGPALAARTCCLNPDWPSLFACRPGVLDPINFLPECEFQEIERERFEDGRFEQKITEATEN